MCLARINYSPCRNVPSMASTMVVRRGCATAPLGFLSSLDCTATIGGLYPNSSKPYLLFFVDALLATWLSCCISGLVDHIGPIDREKRVEMHLYNGPTWMSTVKLHKNKPWTAKKKPIKAHSQWISLGDNEQGIDCVVDATAMRPNCWFMYEYETYFPPTGWELISSRPTLTSVGNFLAWLRDTGITIFTPNGQDRPEEPYAIPPPLWPET
ncbi:hypothetical protein B0T10DRAFT_479421 [Thelonectria olida]|uniref:Uncharacterized protein n=1 Tax=Thelonectria olida TaxID=1576542 RepID=A0A9P9APS2_9HYPO|nr:hypothetical protein B0T10DRAFT_479421 [Thelonectria olida]